MNSLQASALVTCKICESELPAEKLSDHSLKCLEVAELQEKVTGLKNKMEEYAEKASLMKNSLETYATKQKYQFVSFFHHLKSFLGSFTKNSHVLIHAI